MVMRTKKLTNEGRDKENYNKIFVYTTVTRIRVLYLSDGGGEVQFEFF